jgi:hypothetical protein
VVARSKAWICGLSLARNCGFESRQEPGCLFLVSVVCCQVQVLVKCRSVVQRSLTKCGVLLSVIGTLTKRRPRHTRDVEP